MQKIMETIKNYTRQYTIIWLVRLHICLELHKDDLTEELKFELSLKGKEEKQKGKQAF